MPPYEIRGVLYFYVCLIMDPSKMHYNTAVCSPKSNVNALH